MALIPTPDTIGANAFRPPRLLSIDILIKVSALVFSIVVVGLLYAEVIRPAALDQKITSQAEARTNENYVAPRTLAVTLKDYEQQAELTAWVWAIILLTLKLTRLSQENRMLGRQFIRLEPGERILPDDAQAHYKELKALLDARPAWRNRILPGIILGALHRFHTTHAIADAAQAVRERSEVAGNELEADLSLVRFIAWAIPAIGFIGTVRGIGEALAQAQRAISGDITGVVESLGLAFNSTLVALILSIPLMFLLHVLQGRQDKLVLDLQGYGEERVVGQMKVPAPEGVAAGVAS